MAAPQAGGMVGGGGCSVQCCLGSGSGLGKGGAHRMGHPILGPPSFSLSLSPALPASLSFTPCLPNSVDNTDKSQNPLYRVKEASSKNRVHTTWFHLYKILEDTN